MEEVEAGLQKLPRKDSLEMNSFIIGVAGGSGSGKTTLCNKIRKEVQYDNYVDVLIISLDSFYKGVDKTKCEIKDYNFDHPDALDFDKAYEVLSALNEGREAKIPRYNFQTHQAELETDLVQPADVILFEGIMALYDERIRNLLQYKIFVHCDDDIRLSRRLLRDVKERGREVEGILYQYNRFVKQAFDKFIRPTMNYADLVVPGSRNNQVAVSFIVQHLIQQSKQIVQFKKAIKNDLTFFGDMLEPFVGLFDKGVDNNANVSYYKINDQQKFYIFPQQDDMKKNIQASFYQIEQKFERKQLEKTMKSLFKNAIQLWDKVITADRIDCNKCYILNLKDIDNNLTANQIQNAEHIIFGMSMLLSENQEKIVEQVSKKIQQINPEIKISLMVIFAYVGELIKLKNMFKNIQHVINVLIFSNKERVKQFFTDNLKSQDKSVILDLLDKPHYFQNKISDKINKALNKRKSKELQHKASQ